MFKNVALTIVVVTLLALTGCDAGSNSFSQRTAPPTNGAVAETQVAVLFPQPQSSQYVKEMK
jgi:hypothetical protein